MADSDSDSRDDLHRQLRLIQAFEPFCEVGDLRDWRGHYKEGTLFPGGFTPAVVRLRDWVRDSVLFGHWPRLEALEAALDGGGTLEEPIPLAAISRAECPVCGSRLDLAFDGKGFVVVGERCRYPEGLVTEWELNVPSGKLVVANDLREWFPSDESHDVNTLIGVHLTTLAYAKIGMAHGFVGNTCPSVYREGDRLVVGSHLEETWDEEKDDYVDNPEPCPWGDAVASICTDLWWYSIVDHDELSRRVPHYTPNMTLEDALEQATVVSVRPGVYKFRQEQGINDDENVVEYVTFSWVREPDAVRDYLGEERAKSYTAVEVLVEQCLSWPTLYLGMSSQELHDRSAAVTAWARKTPEEMAQALAHAADQIMCVLGGGIQWHENGFPRCSVSDDARRFAAELGKLPPFDFETHWYPLSAGYGGLCRGAGILGDGASEAVPLAPTFVELGLNICQNAIEFGETPRLNTDVWPPTFEVPYARERLQLFVDCYRGLRRRYPDIVFDEAFDAWMRETDLKRYVDEFNFGPEHPHVSRWGPLPLTVKTGSFFEFDSKKLMDGRFCWHPKTMGGAWARKEHAECYRLNLLAGTESKIGHLHMKCGATVEVVPLRVVGRVVRGVHEGIKSRHLEIAFDYGTEEMRTERWALREEEMPAVRQFDDAAEYASLLEQCKVEFETTEREVAERAGLKSRV
jgi:hypothetical protein